MTLQYTPRFRAALFPALLMLLSGTASLAAPTIERITPAAGQVGMTFEIQIVGSGLADVQEVLFYRTGLKALEFKATEDDGLVIRLDAATDCPRGDQPFRLRSPTGLSELKILRMAATPVRAEAEPNNDPATCPLVDEPVCYHGTLPGLDVDCYRLPRKAGERLSVEVEALRLGQGLLDTLLRVRDPSGTIVASVDDTLLFGQDPFVSLVAELDGEYVIEVASSDGEGMSESQYIVHLGSFPRPRSVFPTGGPLGEPLEVTFQEIDGEVWTSRISLTDDLARTGLFPTRNGVAAPTAQPFRITPFGNVIEDRQTGEIPANAVRLPIAFNGILEAPGDVDQFRFIAEEGEVVEFESWTARLGSPVDSIVTVLTTDGQPLARNDDAAGLDSIVRWTCPATGEYLLQIEDKRGIGGPDALYRVEGQPKRPEITAFLPRPDRQTQTGQMVAVPRGNRALAFMAVRRGDWTGPAEIVFPELPGAVTTVVNPVPEDGYLVPILFEAGSTAIIGGGLFPVIAHGNAGSTTVTGGFHQPVDLVAGSADQLYLGTTVERLAVAVIEDVPYRIDLDVPHCELPIDGELTLTVRATRQEGFDRPIDVTFPHLPPWTDGPEKITIPHTADSATFVVRAHPAASAREWPLVAVGRPGLRPANDPNSGAAVGVPSFRGRGSRRQMSSAPVATEIVPLTIAKAPVAGEIGEVYLEAGGTTVVNIPVTTSGSLPQRLTATLEGLPSRVVADAVEIDGTFASIQFQLRAEADVPPGRTTTVICRLAGEVTGRPVAYLLGRGAAVTVVSKGELQFGPDGRPLSPLDRLRLGDQPATKPGT